MGNSSNKVLDQIFSHRSIRRFDPEFEIPREHIELIIKAGQQAATSCSGQMYSVIEIAKEQIEQIGPYCGNQKFVRDASFFCIICVDIFRLRKIVELSEGKNQDWPLAGLLIGTYDAGLLGQNMVLAAESLGYGTCFCGSCGDQPKNLIKALKLPKYVIPLTGLAIGKSIEDPPVRPRLPTPLIHHIGEYKEYSDQELMEGIDHMSSELSKEGYYSKYSKRDDYHWNDHMRNKFGGEWLNKVEKRRVNALLLQKYLSTSYEDSL